jgi:hypothetical protein
MSYAFDDSGDALEVSYIVVYYSSFKFSGPASLNCVIYFPAAAVADNPAVAAEHSLADSYALSAPS